MPKMIKVKLTGEIRSKPMTKDDLWDILEKHLIRELKHLGLREVNDSRSTSPYSISLKKATLLVLIKLYDRPYLSRLPLESGVEIVIKVFKDYRNTDTLKKRFNLEIILSKRSLPKLVEFIGHVLNYANKELEKQVHESQS